MPATDYREGSDASLVDFTGNVLIDALIGGTVWGNGPAGHPAEVSYSFPVSDSFWLLDINEGYMHLTGLDEPFNGYHGLDAAQQDAVRTALSAWHNVAGITFTEVD
jgi:hypothetical protein